MQPELDFSVDDLLGPDAPACTPQVYNSLLKACSRRKSVSLAKQIHAHLASHKVRLSFTLGSHLALTLASCGAINDALAVFLSLPKRTVYSWGAMVLAYTRSGRFSTVLQLHQLMKEDGIQPNEFIFPSLFKACGARPDLQAGRGLHADAERRGLSVDVYVGNSIVSMYGKCGSIPDAEVVFCSLSERTVSSWNAMVGAYMEQGHERKALQLFRQMCEDGVGPSQFTFTSVLSACGYASETGQDQRLDHADANLLLFKIGQALHAYARKLGMATEAHVTTVLLNFYGKCGTIKDSENVFNQSLPHSIFSWSAMLYAYVDRGKGADALHVFREMLKRGIEPDCFIFAIVFQACSILAEQEGGLLLEQQLVKVVTLDIVRALHDDARKKGFLSDIFVGNGLINAYGKCGSITEAEEIYMTMPVRTIVSSTAMLSAFVERGQGHKAFQFHRQLQQEHETLSLVNLCVMLQGCVEAGSEEMCRELHFAIASSQLDLDVPLATTLLSAYGGCACIADAEVVQNALSYPDVVPWAACIAGHAGAADCFESLRVFEELHLSGLSADESTLLSVIASCSHAGLVLHGLEYFISIISHCRIIPDSKHFSGLVDMLARAGAFVRVENLLESMSFSSDLRLWLCLLSACRSHGNMELGMQAFEHAVRLQPKQSAAYTLMANMDSDASPVDDLSA